MNTILGIIFVILVSLTIPSVLAHPHFGTLAINDHDHQQTEIIPYSALIDIEKSTLYFHASADNQLPWGIVEGKIANPASGHPVIIQIFQDDKPVHFAQTSVSDDGLYKYRFRVLNVDDTSTVRAFTGDYTVIIYKMVYRDSNLASV